jgi:broad specificity phosphatase PhoE
MGKIYMVRHGQSADNEAGIFGGRKDSGLTELGRKQARKVAEKLLNDDIGIIYSSPLRRAFDTARIIADRIGIKNVVADEKLMERDFGILSGRPYSDLDKYANGFFKVGDFRYFLKAEGAEEYPVLLERGRMVAEELKTKHSDHNILIVTHGDIGQMIRAAYYGWSWEEGLHAPNLSNTDVFELTEAKLSYKKDAN